MEKIYIGSRSFLKNLNWPVLLVVSILTFAFAHAAISQSVITVPSMKDNVVTMDAGGMLNITIPGTIINQQYRIQRTFPSDLSFLSVTSSGSSLEIPPIRVNSPGTQIITIVGIGENHFAYSFNIEALPNSRAPATKNMESLFNIQNGGPGPDAPLAVSIIVVPGLVTNTSTICDGGTVLVSLTNSVSGTTYRIQQSYESQAYYEDIAGNNGTVTFAPMPVVPAPAGDPIVTIYKISPTFGIVGSFNVHLVPQPIAPVLTKDPDQSNVCDGSSVKATKFSDGSGGVAACSDKFDYRTNGGSWSSYTLGTPISTTGLTSVDIRARRDESTGAGCYDDNVYSWTVKKILLATSSTQTTCPSHTNGTATAIPSGGDEPYSYNWIGYAVGQLDGQNGWNGGNPCGGFVNSGPGYADVVNTMAHYGSCSWYYKQGYGSPGCGTPFTPVVASVGAPGNGAAGDQSIVEFSFKPAALNDLSRMNVYEGSINRDDRTGANLYLQNIGGGLVQLYMYRSDDASPYYTSVNFATCDANVWNTIKMVTDYPATTNSDRTTWGTTKYYLNGSWVYTETTWMHWWRYKNGNTYTPGSSLKFAKSDNVGNGFYIDDVSMVVNNTVTSQMVGTFSAGFEANGQTSQTATNLTPGSWDVIVTDNNGCTGHATAIVTSDPAGPVHNARIPKNYCTIQAAIDDPLNIPGDIITVDAGIYPEKIIVNKSLKIYGANLDFNPNLPGRGTESIIRAPGNDPDNDIIVTVSASDVIINGFTIEGDNPSFSGLINAAQGVYVHKPSAVLTNVSIKNNIIQNFAQEGVYINGNYGIGASNINVQQNLISNVPGKPGVGYGNAIIYDEDAFGSITDNHISGARRGIQISDIGVNGASPAGSHIITGNVIDAGQIGIWLNNSYQYQAANVDIENNDLTSSGPSTTLPTNPNYSGLFLASIWANSGTITIKNTTITGKYDYGILGWNNGKDITVQGGSVNCSLMQVGARFEAINYHGGVYDGGAGIITLLGIPISGAPIGIWVDDNGSGGSYGWLKANVQGCTINACGTGIKITGPLAGMPVNMNNFITNSTGDGILIASGVTGTIGNITNNSFTGNGGKAIKNLSALAVTATCDWFGTANGSLIAPMVTNVTYSPWLVNNTDVGNPGFIPPLDGSSCIGEPVEITSTTLHDKNCSANGSIDVAFNYIAGNGPYTVDWGTGFDAAVTVTPYTITGLAATNYTITVTDAFGNFATAGPVTINMLPVTLIRSGSPFGYYPTIATAYAAAATSGDVIDICDGTYPLDASINISKSITIQGHGRDNTTVTISSTWFDNSNLDQAFNVNADNVTIKDIHFKVVGKGQGSIIRLYNNNLSILNNKFSGEYVFGDGQVTRATEWSANPVTGILMDNNIIESLRQPGYINRGSGTISNNSINNTKGWVIAETYTSGTLNITNNIFGSNSSHITIFSGAVLTNVTVNNNNLAGTVLDWALDNRTSSILNATCNWWGSDNYATILTKKSGPMTIMPYLVVGTEVTGEETTPGFQPLLPNPCALGAVAIVATPDNIICGEADGSISVAITGGTPPYTIYVNSTLHGSTSTSPYIIGSLAAGLYNIDVYAVGSQASTSATVQSLPVHLSSPLSDFSTISPAITAADPGATITVCAGTYPEHLIINKTGLIVKNAPSATPVIDGGGSGTAVHITADNVTFDGFALQHSGRTVNDAGILLGTVTGIGTGTGVTGCTVQNNTLTTDVNGIVLAFGSGNIIKSNKLELTGEFGILLGASTGNTIELNDIKHNFQEGIFLDNQSAFGGSDYSLGSTGNHIKTNTVTNVAGPETAGGEAINLGENCNGNYVTDGNIVDGGTYGIHIWKGDNNLVDGNTIKNITTLRSPGYSAVAIRFWSAQTNTITNNTITGNMKGFELAALSAGNQIHNNNISSNGSGIDASEDGGIIVNATCNWYGTADYATIFPMISGNVSFVPYLQNSTLSGPGYSCAGGPSQPFDLTVTQDMASQNIQVKFEVTQGDVNLLPIPGLDPTTQAGRDAIAALYQNLAAAIAGGNAAAIQAAAMAIGDDAITEYYYYTTEGNPATKTYLKTISNNDLVKQKYWQEYLVKDATGNPRYPNWSTNLTLVAKNYYYMTSTNPATGAVANGWLNNVLGRKLYVTVTLVQNGNVNSITKSVDIPAGCIVNTRNGFGYPTIQSAIDASTTVDGDVITVCAGTFPGHINITKAVDLRGPNYNVSPNTQSRGAEAILVPDGIWNLNTTPREWNTDEVVGFYADGAKMNGFKISGDNKLLNGYNTAGMNVESGLGVYSESNNINFSNNIIVKFTYMGFFAGGTYGTTTHNNLVVNDNKFDSIHDLNASGFALGLYIQNTAGSITNNRVTNARAGIQVQPYTVVQGTNPSIVSGNDFAVYKVGIYYNYADAGASAWTITDNDITVSQPPAPLAVALPWEGLKVEAMRSNGNGGNLIGNRVNGLGATGDNITWKYVWGMRYAGYSPSSTSTKVFFTNNIVSNVEIGFVHDAAADIIFTGNNLSASQKAISVQRYYNGAGVIQSFGGVNNIDATGGNTINGIATIGASLADLFTVEDAITHKIDESWRGLVTVTANQLYVTPLSYAGLNTTPKIQRGVDAAGLTGWTVNVKAGTYDEYNINVNKALTLKGANADVACGSRGAESLVQDLTGSGNAIMSVSSDGVTINGFEIIAPSANNAIYNGASGPSNLNIIFNKIHDVGTSRGSGNVYAVHYMVGNGVTTANVNVSDNCIYDVFNETTALGHAGGIWFGQSTSTGIVNNLVIERNTIYNVKSALSNKETYGIYLGTGWNSTGHINNPSIRYNSITGLKGYSDHAIALDGKTPGAIVTNNFIDNIVSTSPSTNSAGAYVGNTNTGASTITISDNSFTNTVYGIINANTAATVDGRCNWYGTSSGNAIVPKIAGSVTYEKWLVSDGTNNNPGFTPTASSCLGTMVSITSAVPTHKHCGDPTGSINVVWTGGSADYTVSWTDGGVNTGSLNPSTSPQVLNLPPGTYSVTVTDTYGTYDTKTGITILYLPVTNLSNSTYYATIQAAVSAAGSGNTIQICDGLYKESNITVNLPMIIQGQSRTGVKLAPAAADSKSHSDGSWGGTYQYGFLVGSSNVIIKNMTIDGAANPDLPLGDHNFRAAVMTNHSLGTMFDYITVKDLDIKNTYRRGIQLFSNMSTKSTGHEITGNKIEDVTIGPAIAVFDGDVSVKGNDIKSVIDYYNDYFGSIEVVQNRASGFFNSTIQGNSMSNVRTGIQTVRASATSIIGGPNPTDKNTITLNGLDYDIGIILRDAEGGSTVQNNLVTGSAQDAGIWMYNNGTVSSPVLIKDNVLTATPTSTSPYWGYANGIFMADDGNFFTPGNPNRPCYAAITGNTISGFETGVGLLAYGSPTLAMVSATIGNNEITGGSTGVYLYDDDGATGGFSAVATINNNNLSGKTAYGVDATTLAGSSVNATCNWWGTTDPAILPTLASGPVDQTPFLISNAHTGYPGFVPTGSCIEGPVKVYTDITETVLVSSYFTIQSAIYAATTLDNYVVQVDAGLYPEDLIVSKKLTILGPNASIDPCGLIPRNPEAVIVPATTNYLTGNVIYITSPNVTIKGMTIDGNNTLLTSNLVSSGADIDANTGIYSIANGTIIDYNIIKNVFDWGVFLEGNKGSNISCGGEVKYNKIANIPDWAGVAAVGNYYAAIENNCMTDVWQGVLAEWFYAAKPAGSSATIVGNKVTAGITAFTDLTGPTTTTWTDVRGIRVNLHYSDASPWTVTGNIFTNTNTGGSLSRGIQILSMENNASLTLAGNDVTGYDHGYDLWNNPTDNTITVSGGTVTNCNNGVFPNNYDGYGPSDASSSKYIIDGVTITGSAINGIFVKDNPLNANGATVSAEIKNCPISGGPVGILVSGPDAGANIHNNTAISASNIGIRVDGTTTSLTNVLTIQGNTIALTAKLAGSTPTAGIALGNISGTQALIGTNDINTGYFGYLIYNLNTVTATTITGGNITDVVYGVAAVNANPLLPGTFAPSSFNLTGQVISGFAGTYPHTGVYVYTGDGSSSADKITANISNVRVDGTGNSSADCAGFNFADFSTNSGTRQDITVTQCLLENNLNRGINVRGKNAIVSIHKSTLNNNGGNPVGSGGNHGFGIMARTNANVTVDNCHIKNPASQGGYTVTSIASHAGATMNATSNSILNNGNPAGKLANVETGSTLNATCNWWGSTDPNAIWALIGSPVTYVPYLADGTDLNGFDPYGFQPNTGVCTGPDEFYVNDVQSGTERWCTAAGNDANPGTKTAPLATITKALSLATENDVIKVDGGLYPEDVVINKKVTLYGSNYDVNPVAIAPRTYPEAIVVPATNNIADGTVVDVIANGVTIKGLTVDGDNPNPLIGTGYTQNGADMNVWMGISSGSWCCVSPGWSGLTIENNIVKNTYGTAIFCQSTPVVLGGPINQNLVDNSGWWGISVSYNYYTDITHNKVTRCFSGIQLQAYDQAGVPSSVTDNDVHYYKFGLHYNDIRAGSSPFTVDNNTFTIETGGLVESANAGMYFVNNHASTSAIITDNDIFPGNYGIQFSDCYPDVLRVNGGTLTGGQYGVFASTHDVNYGGFDANVAASVAGLTILHPTLAGIYIEDTDLSGPLSSHLNISGTTIDGNNITPSGILLSGNNAGANIDQNSATVTKNVVGINVTNYSTASITKNSIVFNGTGIRAATGGNLTSVENNFIDNNTGDGILIASDAGAIGGINKNSITGNGGYGINDLKSTPEVDGTCNWFDGGLRAVSGNVTWLPYLDSGVYSAPGFTPTGTCTSLPTEWFVNDARIPADDHYTTAAGDDANIGTASAPFRTIQHAIDVAVEGAVIWVDAGTYADATSWYGIYMWQSVDLRGSNYGKSPNFPYPGGPRVAESVILPGYSDPTPNYGVMMYVGYHTRDNVIVDGFTFDGSNPLLTHNGGVVNNGVPIDASNAIAAWEGISNSTIRNNIFRNTNYASVAFENSNPIYVPTSGNSIVNNKFDNLLSADYGDAVILSYNAYTKVENNVMTRVHKGIQTGNFTQADPGNSHSISNNTIESQRFGIWHNGAYGAASKFDISDNIITTYTGSTNNVGIEVSLWSSSLGVNLINNKVTGANVGIDLWDNPATNNITLSGGILTDCNTGIVPNNYDSYWGNGSSGSYVIDGVTINNATSGTGIWVYDDPLNTNGATVAAEIKHCSINVKGTGILVSGSDASADIHNNPTTITGANIGVDIRNNASASVTNNTISSNNTGINVMSGGKLTACTDNNITGSRDFGINIDATAGAISAIIHNNISGNGFTSYPPKGMGLSAAGVASTVDARENWWGDKSGPYHATLNLCGTGNAIQGNVSFDPWYFQSGMTTLNGLPVVTINPIDDISTITSTPVIIHGTADFPSVSGTFDPSVYTNLLISTTLPSFPAGAKVIKVVYSETGSPAITGYPNYPLTGNSVYMTQIIGKGYNYLKLAERLGKTITFDLTVANINSPVSLPVKVQAVAYTSITGCISNLGSPDNFSETFANGTFTQSATSVASCDNSAAFTLTNQFPPIINVHPSITTDARILSNIAIPTNAVIDWTYNGGAASGSYTLLAPTSNILLSTILSSSPISLVNNNGLTDVWGITIHGIMLEGMTFNLTVNAIATLEGTEYIFNTRTVQLVYNQIPELTIHNPATVCYPATVDLSAPAVTSGSDLPAVTTFTYWKDIDCTIPLTNYATVGVSGTYYIKATTTPGGCFDVEPVVVQIDPLAIGGSITPAKSMVCETPNSGVLTLSGQTGSVVEWQYSVNNGVTWLPIANTSTTLNYANIVLTTMYRVKIHSGVCAAYAYSATATVYTGVISTIASPQVCYGKDIFVPVTVKSFKDVGNISLRMHYDATKLTYADITYDGFPTSWAYSINQPSSGNLKLIAYGDGFDLPEDAVLFTLKFTAKTAFSAGGTTDITFVDTPDPSSCEYATAFPPDFLRFCDLPYDQYYKNGTVTVNPLPVCSILGADGPVCPKSPNDYTAPGGMTTYAWSITGNGAITAGEDEQIVTVKAGTNCNASYKLTLVITNSNGCVSTCEKIVNVVDNDAPVLKNLAFTCASLNSSNINKCLSEAQAFDGSTINNSVAGLYIDACSNVLVDFLGAVTQPGSTNCSWTITYSYKIKDECGNFVNCDVVYSGSDQDPATGTTPAPVTGINACKSTTDIQVLYPKADDETALETAYTDVCGTVTATFKSEAFTTSSTQCGWVLERKYTISDGCTANDFDVTLTYSGSDQDPATGTTPAPVTGINACKSTTDIQVLYPKADDETALETAYTDVCGTVTATFKSEAFTTSSTQCGWVLERKYTISDGCTANDFDVTLTYSGSDQDPATGTTPAPVTGINACKSTTDIQVLYPKADDETALETAYTDVCGTVTATFKSEAFTTSSTQCGWVLERKYTISDGCTANDFDVTLTYSGSDQDPATGTTPAPVTGINACKSTTDIQVLYPKADDETALETAYTDVCGTVTATFKSEAFTTSSTQCGWVLERKYTISDGCTANDFDVTLTYSGSDQDPATGTTPAPVTGINACKSTTDIQVLYPKADDETALETAYTDVCGTVTATFKSEAFTTSSTQCGWVLERKYTISDGCTANDFDVTLTYSGSDQDPATGTTPAPVTGINACKSTTDIQVLYPKADDETALETAYTDVCGTVTATFKSEAFTTSSTQCGWVLERKYTISDGCTANDFDVTMTYSGKDETDPVVVCKAPQTRAASICYTKKYVAVGDEFDPASATDNCGGAVTVRWELSGATTNLNPTDLSTLNGVIFNLGITSVTWYGKDVCLNEGNCSFTVTVNEATKYPISGVFKYDNAAKTALNNVTVELYQSNVLKYSTSTGSTYPYTYDFTDVCPDTYQVRATIAKVAGGINATDAAQINYWGTGSNAYEIDMVRFLAGDVIPDNKLNSGDAGRILDYFLEDGDPTWAIRGLWTFWPVGDMVSSNPSAGAPVLYSEMSVPVTGAKDFYGLCTGDFNLSHVPSAAKMASTTLTLISDQTIKVQTGSEFELPVYTEKSAEVGAVSLILNFPSDKLEILGVTLADNPGTPVRFNVIGDELRIGWNSLEPLNLKAAGKLLVLKLKLSGSLAKDETIRFELAANPLNELADGMTNVIQDAVLVVDMIGAYPLGIDPTTSDEVMLLNSYPNPFFGITTFTYTLPENGEVTLELRNMLGVTVKTMISNMPQTTGNYKLVQNLQELPPGVYMATLKLTSAGQPMTRTIKIVRSH